MIATVILYTLLIVSSTLLIRQIAVLRFLNHFKKDLTTLSDADYQTHCDTLDRMLFSHTKVNQKTYDRIFSKLKSQRQ